jgi:class 3 adenylate cyclase/tetratricopeptide (TPR) repeat protein
MNCGTGLVAAKAADQSAIREFNLDRYLPPELLTKLVSARSHGSMAGERRVITILFCDVKGSTAAAELLDPEIWAEIMNGAFEQMIQPIYKYEGTVPRLMGDAILAFFGAPLAHEDDPQRALLAALDIQAAMELYSREIQKKHGIGFKIRVGINTGLVVVGEIGSDLRLEYTAIGDAINLAARMEQTAEPGTIQISEETHKLVAPFFHFESLGESQIKGKTHLVRTFRVLAPSGTPGQLRGVEGLFSPLVGRDPELKLLKDRLQSLAVGEGGFIAIIGEAGLGKTSLLAQAQYQISKAVEIKWIEGHALSYAQSISYFSWRQIIRKSFGANEDDTPSGTRQRLGMACADCQLADEDIAFLEALLAIESEASLQRISLHQGEALVKRMADAVFSYLSCLASQRPLIVALDDLHWTDTASLNLFSNLVARIGQKPILFVAMLRPDQEAASWGFIEEVRTRLDGKFHSITLQPLAKVETNTLVGNLLGPTKLPAETVQLILDKAEGNPFFVEEVIRSLIETKQLILEHGDWQVSGEITKISMPNTLTGVLGARIDRLPEETKRVLQIASVIGRSFERKVLGPMIDSMPEVDAHLQKLEQAGLILPLPTDAESGFTFRHALVQDAAYASMLLKQRRELHRRAGTVLEGLYPDRIEEFAALIAHHFYAGEDDRSLKYDLVAGDSAARLYANAGAAIHYSHALEVALRSGIDPQQVADLYSKCGGALEQCGRYDQALGNYQAMQAFGRERGNQTIEFNALMGLATLYSIYTSLHNPALSESAMIEALGLANQIGDRETQAKLHWNLMLTYSHSIRLPRAEEEGEIALDLMTGSENREQLAFVLNDLSRVYTCRGKFEKALEAVGKARRLWLELDNQPMLADSYGAEAEARYGTGDIDAMITALHQGLEINERTNNLWGQSYDRILLFFAHFDRGEADLAIEMASTGIQLGDQSGLIASSISVRCDLAWAYGCYGVPDKGIELAEEALEIAKEKQADWLAIPTSILIRLQLLKGSLSEAQALAGPNPLEPVAIPYPHYTILVCMANIELALAEANFEKALKLANELLAEVSALTKPGTPEVLQSKGRALIGLGRLDEACSVLDEARLEADNAGVKQFLWPILMMRADLAVRLGRPGESALLRQRALPIVVNISDRLGVSGLRQSFLNQPKVKALMN